MLPLKDLNIKNIVMFVICSLSTIFFYNASLKDFTFGMESYKLTGLALEEAQRKGLPDDVIRKLSTIKYTQIPQDGSVKEENVFNTEDTFVKAYQEAIGDFYEADQYHYLIMEVGYEPPMFIYLLQILRSFFLLFAAFLLFERLFAMPLHTKILLGMLLGGLAGIFWGPSISEIKPVGTAFIRSIQMIVVPLVMASLITGTASLGDIKKMKRIGTKTLIYYLASTAIAITIGLILANLIEPGTGMAEDIKTRLMESYSSQAGAKVSLAAQNRPSAVDTFLNMIPKNPFAALSGSTMLQIIFFSIVTGIALMLIPSQKAQPVIAFFEGINDAMIKIVVLVIEIAPYGVLALIADAVGSFGIDILVSLLKYTLVTAAGLLIMIFLYPLVVSFFSGINPIKFFKGIRLAQLTAFSTSSSGATLPVTMECAEDNLGVSKEISSFVLPLGATVNMDGTALYQGVASVFIAQVYGIPLDLGAQLTIVLTATLASIGTAAAPGVGILMLVIVLQQVGIPLEGIALILAVDRILDMIRTTVNVTSDATAAVIIAATEGQLKEV